jgi:effector-binding domain-containing protein
MVLIRMSRPVDQIPIGTFSLITRISKKALRIYDEKCILVPQRKDKFTGYRYYADDQIDQGFVVKRLQVLGFSLADMKCIMDWYRDNDSCDIEPVFRKRIQEVQSEIERLQGIRSFLISKGTKEVIQMEAMEPTVKEVPEIRVISLREKGTYEKTIPEMMGKIFSIPYSPENRRNRITVNGPPAFICHDDEYKEADADIEIALPISGPVVVPEGTEIKILPATKVVSVLHKGRYEDVGPAYKRALDYVSENGHTMNGPSRELYLNDPKKVPQEELLSEIQIPIL